MPPTSDSSPTPAGSFAGRGAFWRGVGFGGLCALFWGIQAVASRQSVHDGLTASDVTIIRFVVAGLVLLPFAFRLKPFPVGPLGWRRALLLTCVAGAPYSLVLVEGSAYAPAIHSAVIGPGLIPFVAALIGFWFAGERPGAARLAGLALILAGIGLFSWEAVTGAEAREGAWRGDLLFLLNAVMWAAFGAMTKSWAVPAVEGTATIAVLSLLSLPLWASFLPSQLAQAGVSAIALQAVCQGLLVGVLSLIFYTRCVALLGPVGASLFVPLVPVVAALGGVLVLGEMPSALEVAGMAVVVGGMVLALRRN
jgi:drug/metabolite transporter (DMT)-like permease